MKKVTKIILTAAAVVFLLAAAAIVFKSIVYTPEIKDVSGNKYAESIAQIYEIRLGGIEQAVRRESERERPSGHGPLR